ncbi:MAG: SH3 domain-containing protein [Chloroflexi bacterium]|nr:SH3 domain-containing protein [Chloroflexota bacterium]
MKSTGYANGSWWKISVDWGDGSSNSWKHTHEAGGGTSTSSRTHTYDGDDESFEVTIDPENGSTWNKSVSCQEDDDPDADPTPDPTPEPPPPEERRDIPTLPENPNAEPLNPELLLGAPPNDQNNDQNQNLNSNNIERSSGDGGQGSSSSANSQSLGRRPIAAKQAWTCRWLPTAVLVVPYTPGVQCQIVSGAGISVGSIRDQGPLAAVDVWGPLGVKADVCIAARGKMLILNAMFAPRRQEALSAYSPREGVTCAYIDAPGTVVLLPGVPDSVAEETQASEPEEPKKLSNLVFLIEDPVESAVPLIYCRIIARQNLHVRMGPAGERTGLIVAGRNLAALARTDNWFKVTLDGDERWVSAHFVNMIGQCQPQSEVLGSGAPAESIEDLRAKAGRLSNLVFLISDTLESAVPLQGCQIKARQNINVRMEPAGQRTGLMAAGHALTVLARTDNWFKVLLDGEERWVSAHFVNMTGSCQLQSVHLL